MPKLSIQAVNGLPYEEFVSAFGNVVEHGAICAAAVWDQRPFTDLAELFNKISKFIDLLPVSGRAGILRCHPDLAGKLALSGGLTTESTKEQKNAGLSDMTDDERTFLNDRNEKYKAKFGFPFVICARQNKKVAILQGLDKRLGNDKDTELLNGTEEVKKICFMRLSDIVDDSNSKL